MNNVLLTAVYHVGVEQGKTFHPYIVAVFLSACPNFCSYLSEKRVGSVFKLSSNQTPAVVFLCKRSQMQRKKGTECQAECGWRE